MLVIDVSINRIAFIDHIFIHRLESLNEDPDYEYEYEIMDPEQPDKRLVPETVKCKYGDYKELLFKVLEILIKHKKKGTKK